MRDHGLSILLVAVLAAGCRTITTDHSADRLGAPLEGTSWRPLVLLGHEVPADAPGDPVLRFDAEQHRATASAGCNGISGAYRLDGAALRVDSIVTTLMYCADSALGAREDAMLRTLERTRRWRIAEQLLVLSDDAGELARFRAAPEP